VDEDTWSSLSTMAAIVSISSRSAISYIGSVLLSLFDRFVFRAGALVPRMPRRSTDTSITLRHNGVDSNKLYVSPLLAQVLNVLNSAMCLLLSKSAR